VSAHSRAYGQRRARRTRPGAPPGTLVTDPASPPPAVHVFAYGPDGCEEHDVVDAQAVRPLLDRLPVVWVNVDGLGDEGLLRGLGDAFGMHQLALGDVANVPQRSKVEQYGDKLFIVIHMASYDEKLHTEQLSLFVDRGLVLTFQERAGDCLDPVRNRIRQAGGRIRSAGADYLAYALLDAVIDHYLPVLEACGERLEALEDEVMRDVGTQPISHIRGVKRDLLALRRIAWPQRDAIGVLLRDDVPLIQAETRPYLRDCYDHVTRVIDVLETYRELASDLMAVHLSIISNQMNAVMKTLTIMAAIFIPLTFIAGIYGMNFEAMPELKWRWAYPVVLAVMAVIALGLLCYFRRKRWL